jgi:GNAT superfamily N-acetyltransferase
VRTVRLAADADAESIRAIHAAVAEEVTSRLGQGYWSKQPKLERVREAIQKSNTTVYVLEDDQHVIGTVTVSTKPAHFWRKRIWREPDAPALCVYGLAVLPERYRTGAGTQLMRFCESLARNVGLRYVRLDAFEANPASNGFYLSLGYEHRGSLVVGGVALSLYELAVM